MAEELSRSKGQNKRASKPRGTTATGRASAASAERTYHGPPLQVTPEGVEPHPPSTGHVRADRLLAGAAIFMSLLSLLIAYKHGVIMKDLVAANSWPLLQYDSSNVNDETKQWFMRMSVVNAGVGPAIVKDYSFIHNRKRYTHGEALLTACCGYKVARSADQFTGALTRPVQSTVIQAGEMRNFLTLERTPQNTETFRQLDRVRFKLRFDVCYCSVLGDCWRSDLVGIEPQKVNNCPATASAG